jgi:hypothetical protein
MAAVAGSHFGRQVDYPIRYDGGVACRTYIDIAGGRDARGRSFWRCYRLVGTGKEYIGPAELTWREALRLCNRLNREAGLEPERSTP